MAVVSHISSGDRHSEADLDVPNGEFCPKVILQSLLEGFPVRMERFEKKKKRFNFFFFK